MIVEGLVVTTADCALKDFTAKARSAFALPNVGESIAVLTVAENNVDSVIQVMSVMRPPIVAIVYQTAMASLAAPMGVEAHVVPVTPSFSAPIRGNALNVNPIVLRCYIIPNTRPAA